MDEKEIREAISCLEGLIWKVSSVDKNAVEHIITAIEALEKQLEEPEKTLQEFFGGSEKKDLSVTYCSKRHICLVEFIGHDLNLIKRFENIEPDKIDFNTMITETIKELKQS